MGALDLKQIEQNIEGYRAEMVSSLSELISIPSIARRTQGPDPFGQPVQQAYAWMLGKAADEGFRTFDADHFGGHIDLPGNGAGIVGIIGHLDVVPEGDGWEVDPFGGIADGKYVWGRGAVDDKGPVMAAFYAMKALQESGYRPAKTVRLILGLDEETDWEGMRHYLAFVEDRPDCGFTPDADFPVIHGEMGILIFDIARKFGRTQDKGLQLRSLQGGSAPNCVPDSARAVVYDDTGAGYAQIRECIARLREQTGWKLHVKGIGRSLEIRAEGHTAHGACPQKGVNAIARLLAVLGQLHFASDDVSEFIRFYNDHIGFDLHGERMGCDLEDDISGRLIWNTGMVELDKGAVRLTVNVRYPVNVDAETVYEGIGRVIAPYDLGIIKGRCQPPIYIPATDPLVQTLMDVYRRQTGDEESQPLVIGGGTYARAMEGILAFGAAYPGAPQLEHQPNERIAIDDLVRTCKIYAEAIYRLAGEAQEAEGAIEEGTGVKAEEGIEMEMSEEAEAKTDGEE